MTMLFKRCALAHAIIISAFTSLAAQAQQEGPATALEEVIVTANRVPVPLRKIGLSVTVVDAGEIDARGNLALIDVLRQMPAVATSNSGGAGKPTSLRIRGEEGFRTLMIFDGARLTDPSSTQIQPQVENLLSSGVGRVEILRGPQGLSYGADAGGIVNISSRQASGTGLNARLDAQAGEFGTRQLAANVGGANDRADFFASVADLETDGFNARSSDTTLRDDDGYANTTVHLRGGIALSQQLRLELVMRDVDGSTMYDGCADALTFATTHDCVGTTDLQATRAALAYSGENTTHSLAYANTRTDRDNFANGASTFPTKGELQRWEYIGTATDLPGLDLVWGADLEEALNNGTGRDNTGIHGEIISDFSGNLHLTAGVRHDDNDDFGTNTSYRLSGAYVFDLANGDALKFRTSYGTGFRAPSPYEIAYNTGPFAMPPASLGQLRQEESRGHEIGIEYLADAFRLEAVYFDQEVRDAIEFDLAAFSGYVQLPGTSSSKGVELAGEWTLGANWQLVANYTHNDTEAPNGLPRLRRPEILYNAGVTYHAFNERLGLNAFYRVSKHSLDNANFQLVQLDDFAVLDLTASFDLTPNMQLYGRLENALDESYEEIATYNTAGRAAYFGFRLDYAGL